MLILLGWDWCYFAVDFVVEIFIQILPHNGFVGDPDECGKDEHLLAGAGKAKVFADSADESLGAVLELDGHVID
jgi:hypothetical protein